MYKPTKVKFNSNNLVDYSGKFIFIGSCFSETMGDKMSKHQFSVMKNPFGVLFNPLSIADLILSSNDEIKNSIFMRDDVALSWMANGTCFAYHKKILEEKLLLLKEGLLKELKAANVLFITFGTAWAYRLKANQKLVANCHKMPASNFIKELLPINEIVNKWQEALQKLFENKNLQVVFTISPVRHVKDGLIENSRSKAILVEAVQQLIAANDRLHYFPSYELFIDELRDYRFFEEDGVHPNTVGKEEVWDRFKVAFFNEETKIMADELQTIRKMFQHKFLYPESNAAKDFQQLRITKWNDFRKKYIQYSFKKELFS